VWGAFHAHFIGGRSRDPYGHDGSRGIRRRTGIIVRRCPEARFRDDLKFSTYPAAVYKGPVKMPRFTGDQKKYADFRTRIRWSVKEGPAFAGSMAVAFFGCGTECTAGFVTDLKTGRVYDLPVHGEDYPELQIKDRPDSRLLLTQWRGDDIDNPTCVRTFYLWTGTAFRKLQTRTARGQCPDLG